MYCRAKCEGYAIPADYRLCGNKFGRRRRLDLYGESMLERGGYRFHGCLNGQRLSGRCEATVSADLTSFLEADEDSGQNQKNSGHGKCG